MMSFAKYQYINNIIMYNIITFIKSAQNILFSRTEVTFRCVGCDIVHVLMLFYNNNNGTSYYLIKMFPHLNVIYIYIYIYIQVAYF